MAAYTQPAVATADATGKATWTWPAVSLGYYGTFGVIVALAPTQAVFTLLENSAPLFSWLGPSPSSSLQVPSGTTISVTATGLTAASQYTAYLRGSLTPGPAPGKAPTAAANFVAITTKTATFNLGPTTRVAVYTKTTDIVQTGDASDFLGFVTVPATQRQGTATIVFPKSYSGIVIMQNQVFGGAALTAVAVDLTTGSSHGASPQFSASFGRQPTPYSTSGVRQAIIPMANEPGDTVRIVVWLDIISSAASKLSVYGFTSFTAQMRSDGRSYPIGVYHASGTSSSTAVALPALTTPLRYMIRSCSISSYKATAGNSCSLTVTMNGTPSAIVNSYNVPNPTVNRGDWPQGLLLDAATAVSVVVGGTTAKALWTIVYDIVI